MNTSPLCIKIGGSIAENDNTLLEIAGALFELASGGMKIVLIHGGGCDISRNLKLINEEPQFIEGLRITSAKALGIVEMTLSGSVNKKLAGLLNRFGSGKIAAVGLSGVDAALFICEPVSHSLGRVGRIVQVNARIISCLLENNFIPVVSPISFGRDYLHYNVNADDAAGALAGALKARRLVFLSDVPGVLDRGGTLIPQLDASGIESLVKAEIVSGGMIPKLRSSAALLEAGVDEVLISGWPGREQFVRSMLSGSGSGTRVVR